ncbi:MAG TPA: hypothetical protein HA348_00765 [Thermoplasmata archaeon]|nr:hypothetical protein [Thermoplasmata archaeon]
MKTSVIFFLAFVILFSLLVLIFVRSFENPSIDFSPYKPVTSPFRVPLSLLKAKNYVRPDDPLVQQTLEEILRNKPFFVNESRTIRNWVATNIKFRSDLEENWLSCLRRNLNPFEFWQYPEETIKSKSGDCEDFAILLCSLLRANGYSPEEVFVALSVEGSTGHAFVAVKEGENYRLIEPQARQSILGFSAWLTDSQLHSFKPEYLFNDLCFLAYSPQRRF